MSLKNRLKKIEHKIIQKAKAPLAKMLNEARERFLKDIEERKGLLKSIEKNELKKID